ncbi:hypothetical protein TSAR_011514 [Trichomalopsis sarcophagae]|uniref:Uncharacterized protein n=1 Tax=Trichomalopsis sarcophagae TaxID=543379 RepID=A0A232F1H2_9HYME|nr:hypothetical protein TSAR_011514 [Trichomalopsis sarcophagae]
MAAKKRGVALGGYTERVEEELDKDEEEKSEEHYRRRMQQQLQQVVVAAHFLPAAMTTRTQPRTVRRKVGKELNQRVSDSRAVIFSTYKHAQNAQQVNLYVEIKNEDNTVFMDATVSVQPQM